MVQYGNSDDQMLQLEKPAKATTRDKILSCAEEAILQKGFAATSIDELVAAVGITKSGFFYHFRDKGELAHALMERYIENEDELFDELSRRAGELTDDPLQEFLVFLKLFAEIMADLPETHPGCLIASYCYQDRLFDEVTKQLTASSLLGWRRRFKERLMLIAEHYPPRRDVEFEAVADMLSALVDGGIILSKTTREKEALPRQIDLYREFIKAIFVAAD